MNNGYRRELREAKHKYNASSRSGETAHRDLKAPKRSQAVHAQFTSSLSFFIGSAFTVLDAGFALKTHGSFVNGFTPFRAGVAGFDFSFKFSIPAILNEPVFFMTGVFFPAFMAFMA